MATRAEVELPVPLITEAIEVAAPQAQRWERGEYTVWRLAGGVKITQGARAWRGTEAIVWVDQPTRLEDPTLLIVYLEQGGGQPVRLDLYADKPSDEATPVARKQEPNWFGRLWSVGGVTWRTPPPRDEPAEQPAIFARGLARFGAEWDAPPLRDSAVRPAQFLGDPFATVAPTPAPVSEDRPSFRSVTLAPRHGAGLEADLLTAPSGETVGVLSGGARLVVRGIDAPG